MGFGDRLAHAINVFVSGDTDRLRTYDYGNSFGLRPDRPRLMNAGDKSIISTIYNRIAIDTAAIDIQHVDLDADGRYAQTRNSGLNNCLTLEANIDQNARQFKQSIVELMLTKGVVAIVPVDTTDDPNFTSAWDIKTLRVGDIVAWFPQHVRVSLYNDKTGRTEEVTVPKVTVAIVENPMYSVMNESNGTLQRLLRKLNMLDSVDEQISSGKLDMIIQLPYVIKTDAKKMQAENRRAELEGQLKGSKYGIGYTDGTEKITQLNRPVENNMLSQVEYLTDKLYSELGLTPAVFDGSANEAQMTNYYNRTIEPILSAIALAMKRTYLSKTARAQNQSIEFYRDPFRSMAVSSIADVADKFTRNEIMTANEIRVKMGMKPFPDKKADQLVNSNLKVQDTGTAAAATAPPPAGTDPSSTEI